MVGLRGEQPPPSGRLTTRHMRHWSSLWWREAVRASTPTPPEEPDEVRAKEILFSVTFAESFIFEWVRDCVRIGSDQRRFEVLELAFPSGARRSAEERWTDVPKLLHREGLISAPPDWGDAVHQKDWKELFDWRHWLVHGGASRPDVTVDGSPEGEARLRDFRLLRRGWAVSVVAEHVCRLNETAGTTLPASFDDLPTMRSRP